MGIYDRDYMRKRRQASSSQDGGRGGRWFWIALVVVLVLIVAVAIVQTKKNTRPLAEGSRVVNINTATAKELESLPGIGPAKAQLVILGRPYANIADLARVRGISARQVDELRTMLTVAEPTRDRQPKSIWQHAASWFSDLSRLSIFGYSLGTLVAIFFVFPWLRKMRRRLLSNPDDT